MRALLVLLVPLALIALPASAESQRKGRGPRVITINPDSIRAAEAGLEWKAGKVVPPKGVAKRRAPRAARSSARRTTPRAGPAAKVEAPPAPVTAKIGTRPPPAKRP